MRNKERKKVLAAVLAAIMLLSVAHTAMAAETVTFSGETNDGETLSLMTISGVLDKLEKGYKTAYGAFPTYVCTSDFTLAFSEVCAIDSCRVIGLEREEAKYDPDTMSYTEENYNNNGKNYKPGGNKFENPNDGTEAFLFNASVVNDKNVSRIAVSRSTILIIVNDAYVAAAEEETTEPVAEQTEVMYDTVTAKYTNSTVMVDGKAIQFEAYNISGNNYFKLRDLAMALSGTEAEFSVEWYAEANEVVVSSFSSYTPVGGELVPGDGTDKIAYLSSQTVNGPYDGGTLTSNCYNINGNNYVKLREVGQYFDFEVDWDGENNCVIIDTTKPYTAD